MQRISPVKLGVAAILAALLGGALVRVIAPEFQPSRSVAEDWTKLASVSALGFVVLFFVAREVRGSRLLWLLWVVASLDFSWQDAAALGRSAFSTVAFAYYAAFGVQVLVAILLFLPRSSGNDPAKTPNKAPEPTPTSVTPRATSGDSEMKRRTEKRKEARSVPAAVVAHL